MGGDKINLNAPALESPKKRDLASDGNQIEYIGEHAVFVLGGAMITPSVWTQEMLEDLIKKFPDQTKGLFKRGGMVI